MIIVMKPAHSAEELDAVIAAVKAHGMNPHITNGFGSVVIIADGESHTISSDIFEALDGVESVKRVSQPFKLGSRQAHPADSVFQMDGTSIGGNEIVIIAGPCAVESRDQILATARAVKEAGANALRGGVFKPRTSPYSFQGLGEKGLEYLAEARETTGMPVVVEITSQAQLEIMMKYVDIIQVGARNMQNYNLLRALGDIRKIVLLKRGPGATLEELLMSAEYILMGGNQRVILCERGIRTFETSTRNTTDINAIPVLKDLTHLPVILDPSHATGRADYVPAIARAAIAAGADGLMVEVHPDPAHAASDGSQSLRPDKFAEMVVQLRSIAEIMGRRIAPAGKQTKTD